MSIINSVIKGKQPVIDTLNVTPTTSAQQITAPQGTDGYSPVNVSAVTSSIDANIVAGNIKKDVQILGVTGSYEGTTPTGTVNITSNGTHNVSSYEYAEVLVPTTAPAYYVEKTKDANNVLQNGASTVINLNGITDIGKRVLYYAYNEDLNITTMPDFSSLVQISGQDACYGTFYGCTGLTGVVNMGSVRNISGSSGCNSTFSNCSGITGVNLGSLEYIGSQNGCQYMFTNDTGITSVNLGSLIRIYASGADSMFASCTGITSLDLSSLVDVSNNGCMSMCSYCLNLATVDVSHLCKLGTSNSLNYAFVGTALTSISFPNLIYSTLSYNNSFNNMLQGVTGCTVHFPAEWQTTMSTWSSVTSGFGGTSTTVLFDLPNVTTLDLSHIKTIEFNAMFYNFGYNAGFTNITGVDLSSLTVINEFLACYQMFANVSNIISINLSSLKIISGTNAVSSMIKGTGITSLSLPALKSIAGNSGQIMGSTTCTVHLPSNLSGTVVSTNFGSNVTLLFDLPATNILTGADTVEYERNPKYDTATALSWRVNGTMPDATAYYTSGTTDPQVGDTIYSDSALTTAVTTISSIA